MKMVQKSGYIVVVALVMLMAMTIVTERMVRGVFSGSIFAQTIEEREYAKMLALGGINFAIAQLNEHPYMVEIKNNGQIPGSGQSSVKKGPWAATRAFLTMLLPKLNVWQTISTTEKKDGFESELKICITCEQGKLNVNEIFDFNAKKMQTNSATYFLKQLEMKGKKISPGEVYKKLENFFVQRKTKVLDISELLEIDIFKTLDVFYKPSTPINASKDNATQSRDIALQDLFTVWNADGLDPLMLSSAWRGLCGMKVSTVQENADEAAQFKQIVENFDPTMYQDSNKLTKILEPLMAQGNNMQAATQALFCKRFEPTIFSILVHAKVGSVLQRLLVVVKYVDLSKVSQGSGLKTSSSGAFRVLRLYWL